MRNTLVMVPINQFVNLFNKGDMKGAVATCASPAAVFDEFPPHAWQGRTACADWAKDKTGFLAGDYKDGRRLGVMLSSTE